MRGGRVCVKIKRLGSVAILELKMWGGHCGPNGKSGGEQ